MDEHVMKKQQHELLQPFAEQFPFRKSAVGQPPRKNNFLWLN